MPLGMLGISPGEDSVDLKLGSNAAGLTVEAVHERTSTSR
jgi:hypothetical protein